MKQYLLLAGIILSAQTHASHFLSSNADVLSIQSCEYRKTTGSHDFSLLNRGFFVVSNEKKTKLRFTRYGETMISYEGYMTDIYGNRYQGINPKNSQLSDIQFSFDRLKPRATDSIKLTLNLDNREEQTFITRLKIYDAEEHVHDAAFLFKALTKDSQQLEITIDGQSVHTTIVHFDTQGKIKFSNQFIPFEFSIYNKTQDIILNLKGTTDRPQRGSVLKMQQNGYPSAVDRAIKISHNGAISIIYSNGISKKMPYRIAVAQFEVAEKLTKIKDYLFEPNEKSGGASIFPAYGDRAFLQNYVQNNDCLPEYD